MALLTSGLSRVRGAPRTPSPIPSRRPRVAITKAACSSWSSTSTSRSTSTSSSSKAACVVAAADAGPVLRRCRCCAAAERNAVVAAAASSSATSAPDDGGAPLGVVIVDHGSRAKASNDMLLEFVDLYKRSTGARVVEAAHMELAAPSVADAVDACVRQGARRVVVAPYFLSRGRHVQQDVPALAKEAAARHPGVAVAVAAPIGVDPLMARIIGERVAAAAAAQAAAAPSAADDGGASAAATAAAAAASAAPQPAAAALQGGALVAALSAAALAGAAAAAAALAG